MENSTIIFRNRLKKLRTEKKLNQSDLAKELGISRGAVSYYENGERTPDINVLCSIAEYFNVSTEYLLGYSEEKESNLDIIDIKNKTGLSEKSILNLINLKNSDSSNYLKSINFLIDNCYAKEGYISKGKYYTPFAPGLAFFDILDKILFKNYEVDSGEEYIYLKNKDNGHQSVMSGTILNTLLYEALKESIHELVEIAIDDISTDTPH